MSLSIPIYIFLGLTICGLGRGGELKPVEVGVKNTPGIYCRAIGLAMVYSEAALASRVLGRTQNFIAVTGKEVNGFFPVVTGVGVRGWVLANQVYPENGNLGPCKVQVLSDGRLLFGWS